MTNDSIKQGSSNHVSEEQMGIEGEDYIVNSSGVQREVEGLGASRGRPTTTKKLSTAWVLNAIRIRVAGWYTTVFS